MKTRMLLAVMAIGALVAGAALTAAEKDAKSLEGVKCPVSGKAVKADKCVEYKGGKVYFCCENCPKGFAKTPDKFATKANMQLVATGQAKQEKCPLSGEDLNPETKITVSGVAVCFCCEKCQGKVQKAEGDAQLELVFGGKAFDKGFKVKKAEK